MVASYIMIYQTNQIHLLLIVCCYCLIYCNMKTYWSYYLQITYDPPNSATLLAACCLLLKCNSWFLGNQEILTMAYLKKKTFLIKKAIRHACCYLRKSFIFLSFLRNMAKYCCSFKKSIFKIIICIFLHFTFSLLSCFFNDDSDQIELTGLYHVNKTIKLLNT